MINKILLYAIWASLVVAILLSFANGSWFVTFTSLTTLLLTFLPFIVERWYKIHIPKGFVGFTIVFIYASLFLGSAVDFYERFWWWDLLLHGTVSIAIGLIGFIILLLLYRGQQVDARPFVISMFAFSFAIMIGVLWEVIEFVLDQTIGSNLQRSGLMDTMWDLIVDAIGAFIASAAGYVYLKHGSRFVLSKLIHEGVTKNLKE